MTIGELLSTQSELEQAERQAIDVTFRDQSRPRGLLRMQRRETRKHWG